MQHGHAIRSTKLSIGTQVPVFCYSTAVPLCYSTAVHVLHAMQHGMLAVHVHIEIPQLLITVELGCTKFYSCSSTTLVPRYSRSCTKFSTAVRSKFKFWSTCTSTCTCKIYMYEYCTCKLLLESILLFSDSVRGTHWNSAQEELRTSCAEK